MVDLLKLCNMTKEELGKKIEALRKECGVSTYELEQKGIHPSLPATIEKGQKGYSMDSLIKYLDTIDQDIFLSVEKKRCTSYRISTSVALAHNTRIKKRFKKIF